MFDIVKAEKRLIIFI